MFSKMGLTVLLLVCMSATLDACQPPGGPLPPLPSPFNILGSILGRGRDPQRTECVDLDPRCSELESTMLCTYPDPDLQYACPKACGLCRW